MAYEKKPIRILSGGLNLLYAGDKIADDDAQELTNFSTDSFGALRSRKGHALRYSLGAAAVSAVKALGSLWIAAGGSVYKNGAATIAGLSTDVGLAAWKDFVWAMSEADQRKSDGSNDWDWIPEAPIGQPTAKPATAVETEVVDFTGGFSVDPSGDENYTPGFLQIAAQSETEYTATKDVSLDLYTGYSLDDVFRITVWCKQWKKVNGLTFQIDVNAGDFITDYYTAEMKQADINAGKKEEVTFYLRKRPMGVDQAALDKNRYGHFSRIGTTAEKDYRSCVKVRVKVDLNDATKIYFREWVLVGDAENTLEGDDFRVYYTYTTAAGHESNPSESSEPITVNHTGIDVSEMVASGDPQVTGQNVYVTGGTLGHVYRANGNTPVVGTTYQIRATDDDLTNDNLQLEDDHDDPPQVGGLIGPYFGRLIAFGASKFYWSHIDKPYAFAGADLLDGDWSGVEEGVGNLLAATMRPGMLWLYGTDGVVVVQGDPGDNNSAVHRAAVRMGVQSRQGVAQSPKGDFAVMHRGVYAFNGDSAELLSKRIQPVFDSFDAEAAAVGYFNDVLWVSNGSVTYKLDLATGRWFKDSRGFSLFTLDGADFVGVTLSGDVLTLETGTDDAGASFPVAFKSKAYDAGLLDNEKVWEDLTFWADTGGASLSLTAYLNDGQDDEFTVALGVISSSAEERFVLQFNAAEGVTARTCAIRVTGDVSGECLLHDLALNWYPKAREGKSFDTAEQDYGTHKMKILREVVLDLDNSEEVAITLKSDRPEPMANRSTDLVVAATSDRRMEPVVFTGDDILGRLFRLVLNGEDFRCYGGKVLFQVIGTYIEGDKDEYYLSDPMDFGTERIKLVREMELIYAGAGGTITLETDLPGNALATRGTGDFPSVTSEQSIKIRVPDDIKGRLLRVRVTSAGGLRIEAIRLFMKFVGFPNATPWQWYDIPVQSTQDAIWAEAGFPPDAMG